MQAQTRPIHSSASKSVDFKSRPSRMGSVLPLLAAGSKGTPCFVCGSTSHRPARCPDCVQPGEDKQNNKMDWNKYLKRGD